MVLKKESLLWQKKAIRNSHIQSDINKLISYIFNLEEITLLAADKTGFVVIEEVKWWSWMK